MSASRIATSDTSGRSRPSRSRLTPTSTSYSPSAQVAHDLDALQRVDLGVQVARAHARLEQVVGQVLGHLLGQRRDQHALADRLARADLVQQVVDLALRRRAPRPRGRSGPVGRMICSTTRGECCSSYAPGVAETSTACGTRCRNSSKRSGRLSSARGQPEAVLDQRAPCGCGRPRTCRRSAARVLCDSSMNTQEVVGEVVEQRERRRARRRGRRRCASSSRCRCSSRAPAASPCRTPCAGGCGAPPAACRPARTPRPAPPAPRGSRPARARCVGREVTKCLAG